MRAKLDQLKFSGKPLTRRSGKMCLFVCFFLFFSFSFFFSPPFSFSSLSVRVRMPPFLSFVCCRWSTRAQWATFGGSRN